MSSDFNSTTTERDFTEDFTSENGNYYNICTTCGKSFLGHKRRITCKVCNEFAKSSASSYMPVENITKVTHTGGASGGKVITVSGITQPKIEEPYFKIEEIKNKKISNPWDIIHLSKSERKGKTYEQVQELRKQKWEGKNNGI
jgi:hypothetical protein